MKAQNGLKFPSELCFGIMNVTKDSYLINSKVAFLKSGQNAARICLFFLQWNRIQDIEIFVLNSLSIASHAVLAVFKNYFIVLENGKKFLLFGTN